MASWNWTAETRPACVSAAASSWGRWYAARRSKAAGKPRNVKLKQHHKEIVMSWELSISLSAAKFSGTMMAITGMSLARVKNLKQMELEK